MEIKPWLSRSSSSKPRRAHVPARGPHAKLVVKATFPPSSTATASRAETIALDYNDALEAGPQGPLHLDRVRGRRRRQARAASSRATCRSIPSRISRSTSTSCASARTAVIRVDGAGPLRQRGACRPGLKRGGVLNIVRHEVEVICPYDHIPPFFEVNLDGPRDRPLDPHLGGEAARGRRADHPGPRLHGRHHCRRQEGRGGGSVAAAAAAPRKVPRPRPPLAAMPPRVRLPLPPQGRAAAAPAAGARELPLPPPRLRPSQEEVRRQAARPRIARRPSPPRRGLPHEAVRRPRQSGRRIRPPPPQRRLHGARPHRRRARPRRLAQALPRRDGGRRRSAASASCC